MGIKLYLLFVVSWFLHLGSRLPLLGLIRFDLILVATLFLLAFARKVENTGQRSQTDTLLRVLVIYSVLTIPFVEWPGSVIRVGISALVKAIVFYYFTVAFVKTEKELKQFIVVFLACQLLRILEPLYLHVTVGYWGSVASMANWESMDRLSGAPSDVVNPNGLAFIICTVLPFLYFMRELSWKTWLVFVCLTPACIYALVLTGSRTGILGLIIVFLGILVKSKRRLIIGVSGILVVVMGFPLLDANTQDRYLSIIGMGPKNEGSAQGRIAGVTDNFMVALRRPVFGHGIGTSREANANYGLVDQPAHNLYAEVAQELGFAGLVIFLLLLKSVFSAFSKYRQAFLRNYAGPFVPLVVDAMQVWLWMNVIFSFASYGLTSYEWYLLGGFSVVVQRLSGAEVASANERLPNRVSQSHKRNLTRVAN
ncbi:MAG: O-antigen ligase family protein [Gammaproteobacteria bacterium]|nr:O-antigen ligase family protein [Gammaproteobacteria bacterium]